MKNEQCLHGHGEVRDGVLGNEKAETTNMTNIWNDEYTIITNMLF